MCEISCLVGTGVSQKDTGSNPGTNGENLHDLQYTQKKPGIFVIKIPMIFFAENKDHSHGKLYTLLVVALVVLSLILAVIGVIAFKRFNKT